MLYSLPRELGIIKVAIAIRELLVKRARHGDLIVFLSQTGAPIKSSGSFRARRIKRDLLFEGFLGVLVAPLPQGKPRGFPVHVGSAGAIGKALLRFTEAVERLVVFVMHQVQIGSGQQRLIEPGT